jgi:hypothetical protein
MVEIMRWLLPEAVFAQLQATPDMAPAVTALFVHAARIAGSPLTIPALNTAIRHQNRW